MTDQQMHERLRDAGERWRAATPPGDVRATPATPPSRRPRMFLAVAAAAVVVLVAGLAAVLRNGDGPPVDGSTRTARPAGPVAPVASALRAHQWQLSTITFGSGHYRTGAATDDPVLLRFRATTFTASQECSVLSGRARTQGSVLVLGRGPAEQHSCPAPINAPYRGEASQAVDTILSGAVRWSVTGGETLTLRSHDGTLAFAAIGDRAQLIGPTWRLTSTRHDGRNHAALGVVTLRLTGNALTLVRCYTSRARVTLDGASMTVTGLHVTIALPCASGPPGTQAQNALLDDLLHGTLTWTVDGRRLVLTRGLTAATFRAA